MLELIKSPKDIKTMQYSDLYALAAEMRAEITDVVSSNGGHLASNLGIVEMTIALHRVFDFPEDKLIFDVGHQCYAHKLLTGRQDDFGTIRKMGGLSGFTNRFESEYDTFTAGHSGPSVSAGLGIAVANKISGNDNYVVSVVGDGSFTNGMIYEALNNCEKNLRFIVILNDNEMSISSNVGNLSKHFSKLRTSKRYFKFKHNLKSWFSKIPLIGIPLINFSSGVKNLFKRIVLANDGFFTALGVRNLGPVDGHDIEKLESVLNEAKALSECCIIHVKTRKGLGYSLAENSPERYHSVGKFDIDKGVLKTDRTCFSDVFGDYICKKAEEDESIVALTAAMCEGTGLLNFSERFPKRFFDVGIAEEHELAFASGLALTGLKPVCAVYSTFAQRVYDQVFHDFSVQKLPCVLALDRCGFVPDDGITHQGLFDVSLFSSVPGCVIYSPETYDEMIDSFNDAIDSNNISVVRYPKGSMSDYDRKGFVYNKDRSIAVFGDMDADFVIVSYGRITYEAYKAVCNLRKDYKVMLIKFIKVYPVDIETVLNACSKAKLLYLLEEGVKSGGLAEKIAAGVSGNCNAVVVINAVDNTHSFHATVNELMDYFGMTADKIEQEIRKIV